MNCITRDLFDCLVFNVEDKLSFLINYNNRAFVRWEAMRPSEITPLLNSVRKEVMHQIELISLPEL